MASNPVSHPTVVSASPSGTSVLLGGFCDCKAAGFALILDAKSRQASLTNVASCVHRASLHLTEKVRLLDMSLLDWHRKALWSLLVVNELAPGERG